MRPCFNFTAVAAANGKPESATLSIFDEIGFWGVQAKDFRTDLDKITAKTLNVEINSPGGDVFAGLAIFNMLKASGKEIVVKVMGVAASAASLIAMAGDKIVMPKNTFMMVHNPWGVAIGNAAEMRETAEVLDKIGSSLQATYVAKTGQSEDKIAELLATDTWLTADEALELGFATEVTDEVKAKASFDLKRAELPEHVRAVYASSAPAPEPAPAPAPAPAPESTSEPDEETPVAEQVEAAAKAAGFEAHAADFAVMCSTVAEAHERIGAARQITALCKVAGLPDHAGPAIKTGKSVDEVRASLVTARAEADKHISTIKSQADASSASSGVTTASIWNSHHAQNSRKKGAK